MKVSKEIFEGLLYGVAGIAIATCVIFTASFMYIVATGGAQETQDLCAGIVEAFEGGRTGKR